MAATQIYTLSLHDALPIISGATIPRVDSDADDIAGSHVFGLKRRDRHVNNNRVTDKIRWRCARDDEEPTRSDDAVTDRSVCRIYQYHLAHQAVSLRQFSRRSILRTLLSTILSLNKPL